MNTSNSTEKHYKTLLSYPKVVLNNEGVEFDFSGTDYGYFHYLNEENQKGKTQTYGCTLSNK